MKFSVSSKTGFVVSFQKQARRALPGHRSKCSLLGCQGPGQAHEEGSGDTVQVLGRWGLMPVHA
eukprot:768351-Hanusia_phi.AAC.9